MTAMISNIMQYGEYTLFRVQNTLGFTCQTPFQRCDGNPKAKLSDFSEKPNLMKQLGDCMQCSLTKVPSSVTNHCTQESVMSNKAINAAWENGRMSQCDIGNETNCKCEDMFQACNILINRLDENTQCTVCMKTDFQNTQRIEHLKGQKQRVQFIQELSDISCSRIVNSTNPTVDTVQPDESESDGKIETSSQVSNLCYLCLISHRGKV